LCYQKVSVDTPLGPYVPYAVNKHHLFIFKQIVVLKKQKKSVFFFVGTNTAAFWDILHGTKNHIIWDMTPRGSSKNRRFGESAFET
jgi:hypothetical protein